MADFVEIELIHFDSLIKRKDYKRPTWFAIETDILLHPDFLNVTGNEFKAYIWICSVAAKLNCGKVRVYPELCSRQSGISKKDVELCIEKLTGKRFAERICTDSVQRPNDVVQKTSATIQYNTIQSISFKLPESEIEKRYQKYPKKVGKHQGNEKMKKIIKSNEDLAAFDKALENYITLCKLENRETKYIKAWSAFVNQHKDFVEMEIQSPQKTKNDFLENFKTEDW